MLTNADVARQNMIENQVRPWEVLDPRVLDVLAAVRREDFVPARYRALAFADMALPIGNGETMMKPTVEGRMLQALDLGSEDRVLEIGTGSGFVTACVARLAGSVTSIEIHADLADAARARIAAAGANNVRVETADAMRGFKTGELLRCGRGHRRGLCAARSFARMGCAEGSPVRDRRRIAGDAGDAVHARRRYALARGKPVRNRSSAT